MQTEAGSVPLKELLGTVSSRLAELGGLTECIQEQLSPLIGRMAAGDSAVRGLQSCDRLSQELHALSGFLADLAGLSAGQWQVHPDAAIARLTLSTLAAQLSRIGAAQAHEQDLIEFF